MPFAARWPYLPSSDPSDETDLTGRGELPWGKLDAILQWVHPDQPVAFVDDELVPQRWPYDRKVDIDRSVEVIDRRPGRGLYTLVPTAFLRRAQPPDGKVAVEFHAGDALEACQQL